MLMITFADDGVQNDIDKARLQASDVSGSARKSHPECVKNLRGC